MQVIPPGMEFKHIAAHEGDADGDLEGNDDNPPTPDPPIWSEVSYLVQIWGFFSVVYCFFINLRMLTIIFSYILNTILHSYFDFFL